MPESYKSRAARRREQRRFVTAKRAEIRFGAQLRGVARQVGSLVRSIMESKSLIEGAATLRDTLRAYSLMLTPWAKAVSERMVADVDRRDASMWIARGREMGQALSKEIKTASTGERMRELLDEQVSLITSLPLSAAERVHKLTLRAITEGERYPNIADYIMKTGLVTQARANLIARTEVARTASILTQARAEHVGSEGYIWRTSMDSAVRPLHKKLEGKFIRWDEPPISGENGERAHAGQIYNCRCYPEVVLPERL